MKDKILMLVIGILIGAIITAGVFLIVNKTNEGTTDVNSGRGMQMQGDFDANNIPEDFDSSNMPTKPGQSTNSTTDDTTTNNI